MVDANPSITDWMTAVGTCGAVIFSLIFAIWGDYLRRWRRSPTLRASITPSLHGIDLIGQPRGYYLRLWVSNKGKEQAERVQVIVTSLKEEQADKTFAVREFIPINLRWTFEHSTEHRGVERTIPPETGVVCNAGRIDENASAFVLWTAFAQPSRSHILQAGRYRLGITLAASNARPVQQQFEIFFDGKWPEDPNRCGVGLGIREI